MSCTTRSLMAALRFTAANGRLRRPKSVLLCCNPPTERIVRHWHEAVPNDRLAHLVKDASSAFVRALQSRLARHRVPFGQWTFLRILWESDGLTQRELSAEAGVMEPTTHVALNAMERLGYIRRQRLAADRRNVYVHLTAKGRALKVKLVPLAEEVNEVGIDGIDVADVATTRRVLIAIIDNLAKSDVTAGTEAPRH